MFGKNNQKKSGIGKIPFRILAVFFLVMVFALGVALSKSFYRDYEIKKEVSALKEEIESLEKDNYELSQLIDYYQTDQYKEAEARKRLNLRAEGEKVVMIDGKKDNVQDIQSETEKKQDNLPNYVKWWNYFFASRG